MIAKVYVDDAYVGEVSTAVEGEAYENTNKGDDYMTKPNVGDEVLITEFDDEVLASPFHTTIVRTEGFAFPSLVEMKDAIKGENYLCLDSDVFEVVTPDETGTIMSNPITTDTVNHPTHYTTGKFETIELIEEITEGYEDGYVAYCVGNVLKYLARAPYKHESPDEDLRKAAKYLEFALNRG